MEVTALRTVELISGIATGLLSLVVSCSLALPRSLLEFLGLLPFYLGPALLVAVGSYLHAIRRRSSGLVMLLIGGSILTVMIVTLTFGGVFYFYGLGGGLLSLAPSAMAILTMIAALLARRSAANN